MKTLKDFKLKDKFVLLRVDLNSDVLGKKIIPSERIKVSSETIKFLKRKKARVVILAHQGNPRKKDFLSLRQHAKFLNKFIKVKFVEDVCGKKAISEIKKLKSGEVLLLENVRKVKDEFNPTKKRNILLKNLGHLFDIYINDAFSVSHRDHTSIVGFAKKIPSCAGPLMMKELNTLKKIKIKNCLYVLGGGKPESNIKLLRGNEILSCGLFGQVCLLAKGKNLGYQNSFLKKNTLYKGSFENFKLGLKRKLKNVETPVDFAVSVNGKRREFSLEEFPLNFEIEDIGEGTIKKYVGEIKKARCIYMKGPAGLARNKNFARGTVRLLRAIANSKSFSLLGGGELNDAIKKYKLPRKKFNHISLSGGALSNYIAGEKLPGLVALGYYKK